MAHDINDKSVDATLLRAQVGMVFQKAEPVPEIHLSTMSLTAFVSTASRARKKDQLRPDR